MSNFYSSYPWVSSLQTNYSDGRSLSEGDSLPPPSRLHGIVFWDEHHEMCPRWQECNGSLTGVKAEPFDYTERTILGIKSFQKAL